MNWTVTQADAVEWLHQLPDDRADLLFTSPPYERARTYGLDTMVGGQQWVDWLVEVVRAAAPKVKGLIAIVCEGQTRQFRYSATPFLLAADLHRAGFNLRKPPIFKRVGIPGGGGPDWLRNDWEPIVCITRPGKLPWSDNTACGHPPKWAPGGEMAHRTKNGSRVNQWGMTASIGGGAKNGRGKITAEKPRPSHRRATRGSKNGDTTPMNEYDPPALANPGNVVECIVGGDVMGHHLAHENEAPFPLTLAEFFVRSFCPPDGLVIDPFAGSGTTAHAAKKWGRAFAGCDIRESQVDLTRRRLVTVPTELFV